VDTIKNVGPQRITLGEIGMIKILIWIADHAQTLHKPPTAGIGWIRDGHDNGYGEVLPRPTKRSLSRLSCVALRPSVMRQTPAYLVLVNRWARGKYAAKANEVTFNLALKRPEYMPVRALDRNHPVHDCVAIRASERR